MALTLSLTVCCPVFAQNGHAGADFVRDFLEKENAAPGREVRVDVDTSGQNLGQCLAHRPELPGRSNRTTGSVAVRLRCDDPSRPTRYVHADVAVAGTYFIATHDVSAGETINASMIEPVFGDITDQIGELPGGKGQLIGQQARRRITADSTITAAMLEPADRIRRGDVVKVLISSGAYSVETHGQALTPGPVGATVRIRTDNGTVVSGKVNADGTVGLLP